MSRKHYVLASLMLAYFLNYIDRQVFPILAPHIKAEFALSDTTIGFLSGFSFAIFYTVLGIPIARIADRVSPKAVIVVALVVWSGMTFVTAFARSVMHLIICRIGVGVGEAGCTPPAHALIARHFETHERATAMSIYYFGATLGTACAFVGGGWLGEEFCWRSAFAIVGLPGVALAALIHFTMPDGVKAAQPETSAGQVPLKTALSLLLSRPSYRHIVAGQALCYMAYIGALQWAPSYFQRAFSLSMTEIGLWLALTAGITGGIGSIVGGMLADRLGRNDVRWHMWICGGVCLLSAPVNFGIYLSLSHVAAFLLLIIPSTLIGFTTGPCFSMAQGLAPVHARALSSAILLFATNLIGLGLGPQIIGIISDSLGGQAVGLRYAILGLLTVGGLWAAVHFFLAGRSLRRDLAIVAAAA